MRKTNRVALLLTVIVAVFICASPLLANTYIIQKGDTLFSISKRYKTTVDALKKTNNLKSDTIFPGQQLFIPQGITYTVMLGDTLYRVAQKHGITYQALMRANNLSAANIYPGQKLYIPSSEQSSLTPAGAKKGIYILGFYVNREENQPSSYQRLTASGSLISAIAPFWYRLSPVNGSEVWEHLTGDELAAEDKKTVIEQARRNNVQVLALVHNMLYDGKTNAKQLASDMLATPETRATFINQLVWLLQKYGFDGVNLDIEYLYLQDRDKFSLLVRELYQRLAPQGYLVTVSVPAKTWDDRANTWSGPFDYRAIGQYAHYVAIMAYDEHGYVSGPGPIASVGWVEQVAQFAVRQIPKEKILLGIPGYGFDWQAGRTGPTYLSYRQAMDIAASRGARVSWDDKAKTPYFYYWLNGTEHQVWFENASSLSHKLEIVDKHALGGIAIWRLGMEDPQIWNVLGSVRPH